jgi:hypothetical protein
LQAKMTDKYQNQITGGRESTVTGGSDLSLKGPDKEVTNGAATTDIKAGANKASAVDNEVNHGVGEKNVMVASEKAQQGPESKIATTVDKDVAKENLNSDAIDPSQTGKVGASKDSQKNTIRDHSSWIHCKKC